MTEEDLERFWDKVHVHSGGDACWEWKAGKRRGYGQFWFNGRKRDAHRVIYAAWVAPVPDDLYVLHRCDNRACVRPSHLFLGTHTDNMRDAAAKGTFNRPERLAAFARVHCVRVGEASPFAKLTDDAVREIRKRHADGGESFSALGRAFGVSRTTIKQAVRRQLWRHVN